MATVPLLAFFRARKLPVAFTRIVYADDGSDCGIWCEKVPRLRNSPKPRHAGQVVPRSRRCRRADDPKNPGLGLLRHPSCRRPARQGRRHLVLVGCTTSGCVRATAIDAMSSNFRLVVASDCVGDRALGPHEANLFDLGQKYADLLTAREIMDTLAARM